MFAGQVHTCKSSEHVDPEEESQVSMLTINQPREIRNIVRYPCSVSRKLNVRSTVLCPVLFPTIGAISHLDTN